jgi:hypothetical protein
MVGPLGGGAEVQERPQPTQKTWMVGPLGGADGDPGAPTINAEKRRQWAPWEAVPEVRGCPPSTQKTSMVDPWGVVTEIRECLPPTQKMSTVGPLGGDDGDPRAPTINAEKRRRHPPGGGDRDPGVPTINAEKCRRWGLWEVVPEVREHPPLNSKMLMMGPLSPLGGGGPVSIHHS